MARAVSVVSLAACALLRADPIEVRTQVLTNGMKVLVHEDRSIPNVALSFFYRIGSRNERPGTTGLSHFFEHMMFNGAKKYGPKQFDVVMEAAGGANNAYTSEDVTAYMDWCPVSALPLVFDLEGDRIANLAFDPKMVESERGVVISERRLSVEGDNTALLWEQLTAAAFTAHPYHWPVIGWMSDIERWTMADLQHHFDVGYSPANATMVVSGDVRFDDVMELARRHIEPVPARPCPAPVTTVEPEQLGERRVKVVKPALLPQVMVAFHVPRSADADFYALQALRDILFSGQSSRLYQRLVDKDQLAVAVQGSMSLALDPTIFVISAQAREGVDTLAIEKALDEELGRVRTGGVSERELQKAKNALLAEFYRSLKTIDGKGRELGHYEVYFGDYRKMFSAADEFNRVTRDDVQRVARKYFIERNRTVGTLVPEKTEPTPPGL